MIYFTKPGICPDPHEAQEVVIATRSVAQHGPRFDIGDSGGLSRPTSAQQVAEHIRRMIFNNELRAGERVPQDDIAAALRVSRVPVREAVIALDREGWVTTEAHRGAFVNGLDENTVLDHYEFLGMLYGFAARRAAERGTPVGVKALTELNRAFQATDNPDELWEINLEFNRQLLVMARSRRIAAMSRVMAISIVSGKYFEEVAGAVRIHKKGLRAVLRAIKAGDGLTAEAEYAEILRTEAVSVVSLLKSRGLLAA
ncbi:GntR family transcriptional regulator [Streptomyces sp. NPDC002896]|uniref:GntR family transcriptional regulator n=1 Tax=Streptomyces sp. NPDC002896 TaxID=3154438 RepID=UPI00331731B0